MNTPPGDSINVMYCDEQIGHIACRGDGYWYGWYWLSTVDGEPVSSEFMHSAGHTPKTLTAGIRHYHAAVLGISDEQMRANEVAYFMAASRDPVYLASIEDSDVFG